MNVETIKVWPVKRLPATQLSPALDDPKQVVGMVAGELPSGLSVFKPVLTGQRGFPAVGALQLDAAKAILEQNVAQFEQMAAMAKLAGDPQADDFKPFLYVIGTKKSFDKLIDGKAGRGKQAAAAAALMKNAAGLIKFAAPHTAGYLPSSETLTILECVANSAALLEEWNDPERKTPQFLYRALKTGIGVGSLVTSYAAPQFKHAFDSAGLLFKIGDKMFLAMLEAADAPSQRSQ
jgi:hypothetical protein